ncbi:hypothetical protein [Desulfovibrio sp. ZJ200]|uniref:hypothetical protein n=1 Tax=Desulfovibrio sp. ZJ200 TaxID=2709792 RepID=UPI00197F29CC|nr:hypothetical protein [Desulfovibrio sp. ZJ200]
MSAEAIAPQQGNKDVIRIQAGPMAAAVEQKTLTQQKQFGRNKMRSARMRT